MWIYAKFLEDSFRNDSIDRTGVDQKINVAMTFRISWICDTNGDVCQSHVLLLPPFRCGQNARHHLHAKFLREACAVDIRARAVRHTYTFAAALRDHKPYFPRRSYCRVVPAAQRHRWIQT